MIQHPSVKLENEIVRVQIGFRDEVNQRESFDLQELAEQLREADIDVEETLTDPQKGVRDGGLTIAIAIGSLVVSSISAFISVLAYWRATRPKYSVTVTSGDVSVTASELSAPVAQETIRALLTHSQSPDVSVSVHET